MCWRRTDARASGWGAEGPPRRGPGRDEPQLPQRPRHPRGRRDRAAPHGAGPHRIGADAPGCRHRRTRRGHRPPRPQRAAPSCRPRRCPRCQRARAEHRRGRCRRRRAHVRWPRIRPAVGTAVARRARPPIVGATADRRLASARPGVDGLVLVSPDRHGGDPAQWWELAEEFADRGFAVLVIAGEAAAAALADTSASLAPHPSSARVLKPSRVRLRTTAPLAGGHR